MILASGLVSFSLMPEKAMANPCSDISSTGGPSGPGGLGIGIGIGGPGTGTDGPAGPGGDSQTSVECTLEDVVIFE